MSEVLDVLPAVEYLVSRIRSEDWDIHPVSGHQFLRINLESLNFPIFPISMFGLTKLCSKIHEKRITIFILLENTFAISLCLTFCKWIYFERGQRVEEKFSQLHHLFLFPEHESFWYIEKGKIMFLFSLNRDSSSRRCRKNIKIFNWRILIRANPESSRKSCWLQKN